MSKSAELTDDVIKCLGEISQDNGYHTEIRDIYGIGQVKPDKAPMPCLVLHVADDEGVERVGVTVRRSITYIIEAVFGRGATLQDMQRCHHDILKALGYGEVPQRRPLSQGWVGEESAEFDMAPDGGSHRSVIAAVSIQYIEKY